MAEIDTPTAAQQTDERQAWVAPEVVTMAAGSAENAVGPRADDIFNYS